MMRKHHEESAAVDARVYVFDKDVHGAILEEGKRVEVPHGMAGSAIYRSVADVVDGTIRFSKGKVVYVPVAQREAGGLVNPDLDGVDAPDILEERGQSSTRNTCRQVSDVNREQGVGIPC